MKKHWFTMALAIMMALGLSGVKVLAQSATPPPQGEERRMSPERREELKKKVELIWQQKLTEKLNLTEEEKAKVFPLLHQYQEQQRALRQENRQLVRELEKMINANAPEKELNKTIRDLEKNDNKLREVKEEGFHALAKILPVEKQARYIVFQAEFRREMHRLMKESRHRKGQGPREEGPERP